MGLAKLLRMEKTRATPHAAVTFNNPGSYPVPYGKAKFTVSGAGGTGTAAQPSNTVNYNYVSGYNWSSTTYTTYSVPAPSGNFTYTASPPTTNYANGSGPSTPAPSSGYFQYASGGNFYDNVNGNTSSVYAGGEHYSTNYSQISPVYTAGSYTNPYVAATTGQPSTFLGQTFPGGTGGAATPITGINMSVPYSATPISVTVPSGGYVTITPS